MRKNSFFLQTLFSFLACLVPLILGGVFYSDLPDEMATHWNMEGMANGYSSKPFAVFGIPCLMILVHGVVLASLRLDPKREGHPRAMLLITTWIIPVISLFVQIMVIYQNLGGGVEIQTFLPSILGLVFLIVGNYLPKCRQNYTVGIKLPWTLNDPENWDRTHRLAGFMWVIGGLLLIFTGLFFPDWWMIALFVVIGVTPCLYSLLFYLRKKRKGE